MHQQPYAMPMYVTPPKDTTVAYLLAIFLGQFGAHNFYLGRAGCAVSQLVLWILGLATSWIGIGFILMFVVLIWWIVDLCSIPQYIREHTAMLARAWEQQQASHFRPH